MNVQPIADSSTTDLYRALRTHLHTLIPDLPNDMSGASLGLSHSLARHRIKFSADKIDTMIIQAIGLLDDLDKELNTYAMRVKEWYGWHFPELAKLLNDNMSYAKVVLKMGMRSNSEATDLSEILPEEVADTVKSVADKSMGTEIGPEDLENIQALAEQVVGFADYRQQLASYLSARMNAIAPNLTALVGDLVGARLIAHAKGLVNLSKSPASTIQILGAEKALFRALKTKHDTPKYGLIYHASLVGQATGKNKGKMARVLAAKAALGLRIDALADWAVDDDGNEPTEEAKAAVGTEARYQLEKKLSALEGKPLKPRGVAIDPNGVPLGQPKKFEVNESRRYNTDADGLAGDIAKKPQKPVEEIQDVEMGEADDDDDSEEETPKNEVEEKAQKAGLSVSRYLRKLERGEITFDSEGNPSAVSKKDLKRAKKESKKAANTDESDDGKKRKRGHNDSDKSEKKKSKD